MSNTADIAQPGQSPRTGDFYSGAPDHPYAVTVRYVAPASGLVNALNGWAVEVKTKEGVTAIGVFQGDVPRGGMFRILDTLDDHLILGTYISEITEVIVL